MNGQARRSWATRLRPLLVAGLLAFCCTTTAASATALNWGRDQQLEDWLERIAAPYLIETLSRHPRFKNQSVRIVGVEHETIRAAMDDLSSAIAQRLRHALQKTAGVNLLWQPDAADDVTCVATPAPDYLIAIDIIALGNEHHRVALRALDTHERRWIGGFGVEWQGALTRAQRAALARRGTLPRPPGEREHPFTDAQSDLLARALAQRLNRHFCGFVGEPPAAYLEATPQAPDFVVKSLRLVGHYLAASPDLTIVADRAQANLLIGAKIVNIDQDLHQFWLTVRPTQPDLTLPQIDTQAYVQFTGAAGEVATRAAATRALPPPAHSSRAAPATALLSSIAVITPSRARHCRDPNPWRNGAHRRSRDNTIDSHGCFALELRAQRDSKVFLLQLSADAGPVRLLPSACRIYGRIGGVVARGDRLRFPSPDNGALHAIAGPGHPGSDTFVAIAAGDHAAADIIQSHVASLGDVCSARGAAVRGPTQGWLAQLQAVVAKLGQRAEWHDVNVRYAPSGAAVAASSEYRR